jgi:Txe/YoeB family toxin of Txe-Axe toxin-antitoxin module
LIFKNENTHEIEIYIFFKKNKKQNKNIFKILTGLTANPNEIIEMFEKLNILV